MLEIETTEQFGNGREGQPSAVDAHGWHRVVVDQVPGDPEHPLCADAVKAKFVRYAEPHLGINHARHVAESILHADAKQALSRCLRAAQSQA